VTVGEDGEMADKKPETQSMFGSKHQQEKFESNIQDLMTRIKGVNEQVETLNFTLNRRNNKVVQDISGIIHQVLHEAGEVQGELNDVRRKTMDNEVHL
jgi:archaellum component FlaC